MATQTTNYNLTKPDTTDYVDISVLNDNFDAIDAQMKSNADASEEAVTDVAYSSGTLTKTINGTTTDVFTADSTPTEDSTNPLTSGGAYTALADKQDALTFDDTPTESSTNPVTSGGVYTAVSAKQDTLTFDSAPTEDSTNPVTSGGVYDALAAKQDVLTFDDTPTEGSSNPVTSDGIYSAINALLEDRIATEFIAARTGRVWKRKVWKTATNTTPECPALDDYDDGVATPFTDDTAGSDPYMDNYKVFQWMHCNYVRDDDGTARPTALEGDSNYATEGSVDVGTLRPTFWWLWEDTDDTYYTLYFSDSPNDTLGLVPWRDAVKTDGTVLPYFIVASYPSITASDGTLRSQPGKPANYASYNNIISKYQAKGSGYWGSGSSVMTLAYIDLIVKYKTKLEQSVSAGNSSFAVNEPVLVAESGVKRVLVDSTSTKFSKGDGVTVGTSSTAYWLNGSLVAWAEITSVETVTVDDTEYQAIYLDVDDTFDTDTSLYIVGSACPSGQTDAVMGHYDGALISNTDAKHSFRIGGVELMNGLWFVFADTVIEFLSDYWLVYVAPKGTDHVSGAHTNYTLIGTSDAFTSDSYVGNVAFDEETGGFYHAEKGSSSALGTGSYHWNGGTSVTDGTLREWQGVGHLAYGAYDGFAAGGGRSALSAAYASFGSRD